MQRLRSKVGEHARAAERLEGWRHGVVLLVVRTRVRRKDAVGLRGANARERREDELEQCGAQRLNRGRVRRADGD